MGQGETLQLFNQVGVTGFRGLECRDSPPFSLNLYQESVLNSLLPVEPSGKRERGAVHLGRRCSHLCLLPGYSCSTFSGLMQETFCQAAPLGAFSLPHSYLSFSFRWRRLPTELFSRAHHQSRIYQSRAVQ